MTEKPEASVLTARRAAQHFRLSSADDACEHLYILAVRSSLGPSPPNAGRYTVASRFRCRSCERGYIFPRAPEQFVASPLCLVGYVRWDARSDRVPPLQTIIFSSFTGRTPVCRQSVRKLVHFSYVRIPCSESTCLVIPTFIGPLENRGEKRSSDPKRLLVGGNRKWIPRWAQNHHAKIKALPSGQPAYVNTGALSNASECPSYVGSRKRRELLRRKHSGCIV